MYFFFILFFNHPATFSFPPQAKLIIKRVLVMSSATGGNCRCEQLFSSVRNVKSRIRSQLTEENLDRCMLIAIESTPDIERLLKQKQLNASTMNII
jgi:hypothetical protein